MNETTINRLRQGEVLINLTYLSDDVVGVSSTILIDALPAKVWVALTDYDNLSRYLPKVLSSNLAERNGSEIILDQTGKTGIFIFEKHVHFRLKIKEEYPNKITFEQINGDFEVYRGEWLLETSNRIQGTLLSYNAEIKPLFFAPPILVNFIQRQDMPGIMKAHKQRAESV